MTVTTHIAEILRQGVWASLTGGWYYEPSHSIFCNTIHLYLWLLLFILPLIVGITSSGTVSISIMAGYAAFIFVLFSILKITVTYLHIIFDTTEPVVTTKPTEETDPKTENIELSEFKVPRIGEINSRTVIRPSEETEVREIRRRGLKVEFGRPSSRALHETQHRSNQDRDHLADIHEELKQYMYGGGIPPSELLKSLENDITVSEDLEAISGSKKMIRKLSEPLLSSSIDHWKYERRRSSDGGYSRVRRANSTFEPRVNDEGLLSDFSLKQAKENTNKSYPNKISSEEAVNKKWLEKKSEVRESTGSRSETSEGDTDNEVSKLTNTTWSNDPERNYEAESDEPGTSKDFMKPLNLRPGTPIKRSAHADYDSDSMLDRPSTSSAAWLPVRVSLNEVEKASTSGSMSRMDHDMSDVPTDIKLKITKFLEDLIDKHPETLDAIESVRLNRMSRSLPRGQIILRNQISNRCRSTSAAVSALSELASRNGTHVASGHEDTTQGAVHSFQDDEGNWWTYAFDEHGVGIAQPLGSSSTLLEMIQRERTLELGGLRGKLDVLPESAYVSSEDEDENQPSTSLTKVQTTRRERALSSSSNESYTYIPSIPTTVLHAPSRTGATRRQMVSFVNVASRIRSAVRAPTEERQRAGDLDQIMELLDRRRSDSDSRDSLSFSYDRRRSGGGPLHARMLEMQERIFRLDPDPVVLSAFGDNMYSDAAKQTGKKSYYYVIKMFPKSSRCIKVKLDRLAVAALFDRNRGALSCMCDILLASIVSVLAALVISTGIFYDLSLFFFAFGVAGAHFSLLKSVQPDAASPIHGFNWLVAYSRPVYFSVLSLILLFINAHVSDVFNDLVPWNWNPYRLPDGTTETVILGIRDLISYCLLLLPVACTLGWLPQVSTLVHHVLEQVEMHIFGGTASFGVISTIFQVTKSLMGWGVLVGLTHLAKRTSPSTTQSPAFSTFLAVAVGLSYALSRFSSNVELTLIFLKTVWKSLSNMWRRLCRSPASANSQTAVDENEIVDPLPDSIIGAISLRARHDILFTAFISCAIFALHSSSVFTVTRPYFFTVITLICCLISIINHYVYPQLRTHTPWKLIAKPILKSGEYNLFECVNEACLMPFERVHVWMQALEKNIFYPLLVVCILCDSAWSLPMGVYLAPLVALRLLRGGFCHPQLIYVPLLLSLLITRYDWATHVPKVFENFSSSALFTMTFYLAVLIYPKWLELYLKTNFIMAYVAPWQISWGSAFHAFAQPFSVPHSALLWIQTVLSSIVSAPLNPFLGSSFFLSSYVRPVKFWERDYNTKRSDASNTRLSAQIDRGPMLDDSNLNAVFYEHLTRSLQKSLAGDLLMGRWATSVHPGDCFILAGFYLNCLVHIVEVGNGFITFQLRGLEFRGTYCHQREVEAITEDQTEGTGFCCCSPGSLPGFLSLNTAWGLRWLAWEVVAAKYVVDGYSITDNSAVNLLQVHELRRLLVSLYVKCIIYYATSSDKLTDWINNEAVHSQIDMISSMRYVDTDGMFCAINDEDYDCNEGGISKMSFIEWYSKWITHCLSKKGDDSDNFMDDDKIVILCYMLSLLGRRTLGTAAHNRHSTAAESFLYGLHALFKGDFRIQSTSDEWVFADMDLLRLVISPAVKMALKLHQDHFAAIDDLDDNESLYNLISDHQANLFISHEQDPAWRKAILTNTPSLLALRHMYDDGQDDYKIIMLNKMHQNMRVIKLNRECVRAFWAGQQQELIFLRNRNPERGSIQNARQVLRNMINSSADQPVGYPIYVSPLTTSFVDSHPQISKIVGEPITLDGIGSIIHRLWRSLRFYLGPSTSSLSQSGCQPPLQSNPTARENDDRGSQLSSHVQAENSIVHMSADGTARVALARRSHCETPIPLKKTSVSDATAAPSTSKRVSTDVPDEEEVTVSENRDVLATQEDEEGNPIWVEITDTEHIFKYLNEPLKSTGQPLVEWPSEDMRQMACHKQWYCQPMVGTTGRVVYRWYPNHPNKKMRSHIGATIYLICVPVMANGLVAVGEGGCKIVKEKFEKTSQNRQNTP